MASILAVILATSCAAERSFSGLRGLKTLLRNTIGQHRLNSLDIMYSERAYGNQVIVNSMDKMTDIFGQRHGRKNFFFSCVLDNFETVDRIKYANFQPSFFSNDSSFIRWENGNRLHLHPDFNPHPFGHCVFFSGKEVTAPPPPKSEGARTPM